MTPAGPAPLRRQFPQGGADEDTKTLIGGPNDTSALAHGRSMAPSQALSSRSVLPLNDEGRAVDEVAKLFGVD